jgi:S1-C subfamily serine protease
MKSTIQSNRLLRILLISVLITLLIWLLGDIWNQWSEGKTLAEPRQIQARGSLAEDEESTINVFKDNNQSVVYISTVKRLINIYTRDIREIPSGTGTGFVWDNQGHIVTNYHVVKGHKTANVRLSNQKTYKASVVGVSPEHDLAVLSLDNSEVMPPPVKVGTSQDLQVGQKVFAIGNPFGLDHTLTTGIISALDRSLSDDSIAMDDLIQTDAAINPGNSGGPLLDSAGRLIGVNVAIYSPSGASAGIGFAIPVDTVNRVIPNLLKHGRYIRPVLGISANKAVSEAVMKELGKKGVLILKVSKGSPAEQAGLHPTRVINGELVLGDFIQSIDGKAVENMHDLLEILDKHRINDVINLGILRAGEQKLEVRVKLSM